MQNETDWIYHQTQDGDALSTDALWRPAQEEEMQKQMLDFMFLATVFIVYFAMVFGLRLAWLKRGDSIEAVRKHVLIVRGALAVWIILIAAIAASGAFLNFSAMPPRVLGTVLLAFGFVIYFLRDRRALALLKLIPPAGVIALQTVRVVIEFILWQLERIHLLPIEMTFAGHNFDILIGITAPVMAFLALKPGREKLLISWNAVGLVLLTNVVVTGLLSAPTPFRVFHTDPPTFLIGTLPYVLLPTFLVPVVYLLHALSIHQALSPRS